MSNHIKGIDYSRFALLGRQLRDIDIDRYTLKGFYGEQARENFLIRLRGKAYDKPTVLQECREGVYGPDAQAAVAQRKVRRRSSKRPLTQEELLKCFGL